MAESMGFNPVVVNSVTYIGTIAVFLVAMKVPKISLPYFPATGSLLVSNDAHFAANQDLEYISVHWYLVCALSPSLSGSSFCSRLPEKNAFHRKHRSTNLLLVLRILDRSCAATRQRLQANISRSDCGRFDHILSWGMWKLLLSPQTASLSEGKDWRFPFSEITARDTTRISLRVRLVSALFVRDFILAGLFLGFLGSAGSSVSTCNDHNACDVFIQEAQSIPTRIWWTSWKGTVSKESKSTYSLYFLRSPIKTIPSSHPTVPPPPCPNAPGPFHLHWHWLLCTRYALTWLSDKKRVVIWTPDRGKLNMMKTLRQSPFSAVSTEGHF